MAAIAGKVAITPKGEWDVATQYEKLDFILHGDDSYVARKASLGVEPGTDDETWQLSLRGASSQQINDILDGTTPVGDADSLGGETAEEWQGKIDEKLDKSGGTVTGNIKAETSWTTKISVNNTAEPHEIAIESSGAGSGGLYDYKYGKWLLKVDKDENMFIDGDTYKPLHTGNKPTGTYTGNGNANTRSINIGGIGNVLLVWYEWGNFALVHMNGLLNIVPSSGTIKAGTYATFRNGILTIDNSDGGVNGANAVYHYQVL